MTQEGNIVVFKTLYEWCYINNIRPYKALNESDDYDNSYMLDNLSLDEFKSFLESKNKYKRNSLPRKPEKFLERRMYYFVPYNISPIQQGIQALHANSEYEIKYATTREYQWWLHEWKTAMVMNGGTSNEGKIIRHGFKDNIVYVGTMQTYLNELIDNDINVGAFYEPDLNNMLTGISVLIDERVFDTKNYPDFQRSPLMEGYTIEDFNKWQSDNEFQYTKWVEKIGGQKNVFLRSFLVGKRRA